MLDGLKSYYEKGLNPSEEVSAATQAYRLELDIIEQWLEEQCEIDPKSDSRSARPVLKLQGMG